MTVVLPSRERTRLAGVDVDGASANARRTASAFSSPTTRKTTCAPDSSAGIVSVTRSTNGSRPGSAATARRSRSSRVGASGKERRGVSVRAEAEQDEVERLAAELGVVRSGGLVRRQLGRDGVHGRVDDDPVEQRVAHEQLVGQRIVRGHAAVVAEPEIDAAPVPVERGRELVRLAGSGAAGQHHGAARLDGLGEERGHRGGRGAGIGDDDELDVAEPPRSPRTTPSLIARPPTERGEQLRPSPRPRDPPRGRGRRRRS